MRETAELWVYEREAREQGFTAVCGVDEAGAGPLMGPVYAAAVILPEDCGLPELNGIPDSGRMSHSVFFLLRFRI